MLSIHCCDGVAMATSQRPRLGTFDKRTLLEAHPFFRGLDDEIIEHLLPHALIRQMKKGTVIFRKGDIGTNLFAVCAGVVRISAPSEQAKETIFNLIIPGEIFGEIAFLDGGERTADAVTVEDGELMVIEHRDFFPVLRAHPELAIRLLEILCRRLRKTSGQLEDIVFFSVQIRLAKALLYLYRRNPSGTPEASIRITQQDLSQMVGASRETTNRELQFWQEQKWLKLKRSALVILKPNELERLIQDATQ
jgi:CRP/FNR family cyclic AMP-dependent transcriptional regulator